MSNCGVRLRLNKACEHRFTIIYENKGCRSSKSKPSGTTQKKANDWYTTDNKSTVHDASLRGYSIVAIGVFIEKPPEGIYSQPLEAPCVLIFINLHSAVSSHISRSTLVHLERANVPAAANPLGCGCRMKQLCRKVLAKYAPPACQCISTDVLLESGLISLMETSSALRLYCVQ